MNAYLLVDRNRSRTQSPTVFLFPFNKKERNHFIFSHPMKRNSFYNSNYNNNGNAKPHRWALSLFLLALVTVLGWRRLRPSPSTEAVEGFLPALPRLAYVISGSKGDGPRVERLLRAVYHRRNYYVVHLDSEASEEERAWVAATGLRNVMDVGPPNVVTAKGPTEMAATLHSAAILLKNSRDWDWFVNLAASDYPLFSQHDLLHVLSYLPRDLNFLEHTSNLAGKEEEMGRPIIIDSGLYHTKKSAIFWAKERRSMPASFKLFMGSAGVMVSRALVEMCVVGWDNLPRTLLMYQTNMLRSSESYFHTVACNHKEYQNTTVNHSLRVSAAELSLHNMLRTGAPFANGIHRPQLLDAIDAHLARHRHHPHPYDSDTDDVVVPSADSSRLQNLLLNLLHPRHFRPNQCN